MRRNYQREQFIFAVVLTLFWVFFGWLLGLI
jgi:hypothetical protein